MPLVNADLASYSQGFTQVSVAWPPLPLPAAQELARWERVVAAGVDGVLQGQPVLAVLNNALPQLRLPKQEGISSSEFCEAVVLCGDSADAATITAMGKTPQIAEP